MLHEEFKREEFDSLEDYIQIVLLGHCGCGRPPDSLNLIFKLFSLIKELEKIQYKDLWKSEFYDPIYTQIEDLFHNDDGLQYLILYMLNKEEFLEHGGSVISSWLTPKGEKLFEALKEWNQTLLDE